MDNRERCEREGAGAELRSRLSSELVRAWETGPGLEVGLFEHLRSRDHRLILFDPARMAGIEEAARSCDPDEWAWERRIADNAVNGLVYAATNPYCDRFVRLPEDFDFASYDDPDPQAIMGLNRHRWFPALARSYHHRRERRYFDALMREWDFYVDRVPFTGEAFRGRSHELSRELSPGARPGAPPT